MSKQSFPPKTTIRSLKSFVVETNVHLGDRVPALALDGYVLRTMISKYLTEWAFTIVGYANELRSGTCDARVKVNVIVAETANSGGSPLAYCFTVHLTVQTTVPGRPDDDLFIVYDDLSFSMCDPVVLSTRVIDVATGLAKRMAESVTTSQNW